MLSLVLLGLCAPTIFAARPSGGGKTIKDLSGTIPLGLLERSVGPKFYRSLLVSPVDDWSTVRARVSGRRLSEAGVVRPARNPAYNALAIKFASELTLAPNDPRGRAGETGAALMHLWIYKIADGLMAVSFAYPETRAGPQRSGIGTVRLSVATSGGRWTEIRPRALRQEKNWSVREHDGHRLRRIDRMPMDVISGPAR